MLNRGLSMGWHGWMEMVEERHEAIGLLRKGVGFMQNRGLAIGFNGWMDAYAGQLGLDLSRRAMARAIKYLLNKGLARGFNGIKAIWDEALLLRETGRKRRQLHREIVKAQRMAANLYTQGQSSEFLARSASDARHTPTVCVMYANFAADSRTAESTAQAHARGHVRERRVEGAEGARSVRA